MYYYEVFRCFKSKVVLKSQLSKSLFQVNLSKGLGFGQLQVSNGFGGKKHNPHKTQTK